MIVSPDKKKMKIGIITFHFAFNQGAALQCYALQEYLKSQGHEVRVINYRPKYHTVMHSAVKNPFIYTQVFWKRFKDKTFPVRIYLESRRFARFMYMNITRMDQKTQKEFRKFEERNLHLTKPYTTLKQLQKNPPKMQVYISGSDQLWNPELLNQSFDSAYFLNFGDSDVIRVAYAVSIGREQNREVLSQMKELCAKFSAISLREYSRAAIKAIDRDVHICLDPTLLLDASEYAKVESRIVEDTPYVFVYGFETTDEIIKAVNLAKKKYNCQIINGSPRKIKLQGDIINLEGYGPDRFLSLVKNAKCVITNSFHGTAFSIIYKKDFITIPHSSRGKRMADLLEKLKLNYRLWGDEKFSFNKEIDYFTVYQKLNTFRKQSKEYLRQAISGCRGENISHAPEEKVSYKNNENRYSDLHAYYGYYKNEELLKQSSSGGAATAISEQFIRNNGVVVGVAYSEDFKSAEFQCVETLEGLKKLKGSKYITPKTTINGNLIYDIVENKLKEGKKVLFIGCGCYVGILLKKLEKHSVDITNLFTIDLICHGPTFQIVQEQFINNLEKKYGAKVIDFSVRYKKQGWIPPYVYALFSNGKKYSRPLYETDFGFAFRIYVRNSCYSCQYKGENHVADITIGDYWGLKPGMKEYNRQGVSILLSRSDKGEKLISMLTPTQFFIGEADADKAIGKNRMYEISLEKSPFLEEFEKDFKEKGLHYAVLHSKGYKSYVKRAVKNRILKLMKLK